MKIVIEISPDKDPKRAAEYFYEKCLDLLLLGEINKFKVSVEGTKIIMER